MKIPLLLVLLLPGLIDCELKWKVDQPHRYIIYNGKYMPLSVAEDDTTSSSIIDSLNPLATFHNIWSSLPSLNFFKSKDPEVDTYGDPTGTGMDYSQMDGPGGMLAEESAPVGMQAPFSDFISPSPPPSSSWTSWLPSFSWPSFLGGSGGSSGSSDEITGGMGMASLGAFGGLGSEFMKRNMDMKDPKHKGPVRYLYRPQGGQGGYLRYEIPIPTPEEIAQKMKEEHQKRKPMEPTPASHPHPYPYPPSMEAYKKPTAPYKPMPHKVSNNKKPLTRPYFYQDAESATGK